MKNHQHHVAAFFPWLMACHQVVNCCAKAKKKTSTRSQRSGAVATTVANVHTEPVRCFLDIGPNVELLEKFKKVCNLQRWDFLQFATFEGLLEVVLFSFENGTFYVAG